MTEIMEKIAQNAAESIPEEDGDYTQDGLLYCGQCHTPKECRVAFPMVGERTVRCLCDCAKKRKEAEIAERKRQEEYDRLVSMRSVCMSDRSQRESTFASADGRNAAVMASLKRYCDAWPEMRETNTGLILYGGVGTGKSFAAACMANEIMEKYRTPVLMTNFSRVLNGLFDAEDKNGYIQDIVRYPLLIIDDFGVERASEYTMEQVYNVIDARYRTKLPLIMTTNLTAEDLDNPKNIAYARIYSRLTEMCIKYPFGNDGFREQLAEQKRACAREILRGMREGVTDG